MSAERPSMIEQRDAEHDELWRVAAAAFKAEQATVAVDPRAVLSALATLDAYRDMAGLGSGRRRRMPETL